MHADPLLAEAARQAWVGQRIERLEDDALLNGRGAFADDIGVRPGTLEAVFYALLTPMHGCLGSTQPRLWHFLACAQF